METYENNEETVKKKKKLTEMFLEDSRVHDLSDWIFIDGLAYCAYCYKMYPHCLGYCKRK